MEEKTYKTMKNIGGWNIALGVAALVMGLACGIMMIINGARLLSGKSKILF